MGLIPFDEHKLAMLAMYEFEEDLRKRERKEAAEEMDKLRKESTVAWEGAAAVRTWRKLL